jgi:hypothetical protein
VKQNPDWTYEGIAFYVDVPGGTACAGGTTPVYRSFYPGAAVAQSNHRFTVDLTVRGWMRPNSGSLLRRDVADAHRRPAPVIGFS